MRFENKMEVETWPSGQTRACGQIAVFDPPLEGKTREAALLIAKVSFWELCQIGNIMNELDIEFLDAVRVYHERRKANVTMDTR